jgi:hypothetical protein
MPDTAPSVDPDAPLLAMDVQPAILGSLSDTDAMLSRVAHAIAVVRPHGGHVVASRARGIGIGPVSATQAGAA